MGKRKRKKRHRGKDGFGGKWAMSFWKLEVQLIAN